VGANEEADVTRGAASNDDQSRAKTSSKEPVELAVQVLGLVAVLLPVMGLGIRAVAFAISGVPNPMELAEKDGVPDLALTAVKAAGPLAVFYAVFSLAVYYGWLGKLHRRTSPSRVPTWAAGLIALMLLAFLADFPGEWIVFGGGLVAGLLLARWEIRKQLTFYRISAGVLVAGAFASIAAGIAGYGVGDETNLYRFASTSNVADGKYVLIGQSDGLTYLDSCVGKGIVGVSDQQIVWVKPSPPPVGRYGTLIDDIFAHNPITIGYLRQC
jgi:hypothetical protein